MLFTVFPILQKTAYSGQVDRLRYASEVFYCKYAPAQVPRRDFRKYPGLLFLKQKLWA
jgi:hypothetical protein